MGPLLIFIAITGSLISYRALLEPAVYPSLLTVPACADRLPLDTLIQNARVTHPAGEADYIRIKGVEAGISRVPAAQVRINGKGFQDDVFLNPCTGEVLGQRGRYGGFLGSVEALHKLLFLKPYGQLTAGLSALILAIGLVGFGIYMWWPRRPRSLRESASFNPRLRGRYKTLNLHKVIGCYAAAIVLVSALTGLPQAFDWYKNGIYWITGSTLPEDHISSPTAGATARLPVETFHQRAVSLVPNPREMLIHIPVKPHEAVEIYAIGQYAPHANARTLLSLDAYTGEVLQFTPYSQSSLGHKVYFWTLSWHTGKIGGLLGPAVLLLGALSIPFLAYTGTSSYLQRKLQRAPAHAVRTVQVVRKSLEAEDVCTFELADPRGGRLPKFSAGSHIDIHVGEGLIRQYSLCNDPRETHRYLIGVLRTPGSRGGSMAMHYAVQEGDLIKISKPRNNFPLAHSAKRSLLLAGGIGVTPILCMAERLSATQASFEMHYCTRSVERTAFLKRIEQSTFANSVSFHFEDGPSQQRFDAAKVLTKPLPGTHLYVCGPKGFMNHVFETARAQGWDEQTIHQEYFTSNMDRFACDSEFDVKIASTGQVYRVCREKSIVTALSENGINVPVSCEQGVCGTCLTGIIEGEPDHRDQYLRAEQRARNDLFTPCCSRAKSPVLVLDL